MIKWTRLWWLYKFCSPWLQILLFILFKLELIASCIMHYMSWKISHGRSLTIFLMEQLHQTNSNELGDPMMPTYMRGWMLNQSRLGILLEAYLVTYSPVIKIWMGISILFHLDGFFDFPSIDNISFR